MSFKSDNGNAQLRRHLPPSGILALTRWVHRARGAALPSSAVVYPTAQLLRYPQHIRVGPDAVIKGGAHICPCNEAARIEIGARTTIGFHTFIYASDEITIGEDCMVAPFVYLVDSNHGTALGLPMNRQPNQTARIVVEDDVWIGARVVIAPGVRVERGAVIGAGSVVTQSVPAYTVVAGVPARIIRTRA